MPSLTLYHQSAVMIDKFYFSSSLVSQKEKDIWIVFYQVMVEEIINRFGVNIRNGLYTYKNPSSFALENFGSHVYRVETNHSHRAFYAPKIEDVVYNLCLGQDNLIHIFNNEVVAETCGQATLHDFVDHAKISQLVGGGLDSIDKYLAFSRELDILLERQDLMLDLYSLAVRHVESSVEKIKDYVASIIEINDMNDLQCIENEEIFIFGEDVKVTHDMESSDSLRQKARGCSDLTVNFSIMPI